MEEVEILKKRIEVLNSYSLASFDILQDRKRKAYFVKVSVKGKQLVYPASSLAEERDGVSNYVWLQRIFERLSKVKRSILSLPSILIVSGFSLEELVYEGIMKILGPTNSSLDLYLQESDSF